MIEYEYILEGNVYGKSKKKLIREKAVIAVYQYLLTNSTEEEIMNYLNECYKPRMDEREIELCKEIVFNTIERIDEYVPLIEKNLKNHGQLIVFL